MRRTIRTCALAAATVLTLALVDLAVASGASASTATATTTATTVAAPTAVQVTRSAAKPNDFVISWGIPVSGTVAHYDVTVFADGQQTVTSVPATARNLAVTGHGAMSIYQVRVGARTSTGGGQDSDQVTLEPLVAGAPIDVVGIPASVGSGIAVSWSAPGRPAYSAIDHYHVVVTDRIGGTVLSKDVSTTSVTFPTLNPAGAYLASVAAVTNEGAGLVETVELGGAVPTPPRGVTAVRDPADPSKAVISWDDPSYPGTGPMTGFQLGQGQTQVSSFSPVASGHSAVVSLPTTASAMFAVRSINANGASATSMQVFVQEAVDTLAPTSAYPVSITVDGRTITASFVGHLGSTGDSKLLLRVIPATGWTYREEEVVDNGQNPSETVSGVPAGRYKFSVSAYNPVTAIETQLLVQDVFINDSTTAETATEASFAAGVGLWTGVYPAAHLPRVVASRQVAFDGAASLAITATASSIGQNVAVGTNGQRGVPVTPGQQLIVSAQGMTTTPATAWNVGISWWSAAHVQLAVARTPQQQGYVGSWRPSAFTFTAPAGAALATAFVEAGDLLANQTVYIDGIALRSTVVTPHAETPLDWQVVQGTALVSGSLVAMSAAGETNVLDPYVQAANVNVQTTGRLVSGPGYGIWLRGSWSATTHMSGYSLQLDPGYGGKYILRHWYLGAECSQPLAQQTFPTGFDPFAEHQISVTISGNTLNALVDGTPALSVTSLSAALASESCHYPAPTGTSIGFRKWGVSVATLSATVRSAA